MRIVVTLLLMLGGARLAGAYPQWQLARDATCSSCHLAPDGGGLLNENGLATAEAVALQDHDAAFMYGALDTPPWLTLGGDLRGAGGYVYAREGKGVAYPMQAEVAAVAVRGPISLHLTGGLRRPNPESALHVLWSREHYVMWRLDPSETHGVFVRAGRFMPTFGLRLAEHIVYTQRFGGRQLYHEAYGASVAYVDHQVEVHVTGFVHDPIARAAEQGDGGAIYGELRLAE
jgi:hypothetical protein